MGVWIARGLRGITSHRLRVRFPCFRTLDKRHPSVVPRLMFLAVSLLVSMFTPSSLFMFDLANKRFNPTVIDTAGGKHTDGGPPAPPLPLSSSTSNYLFSNPRCASSWRFSRRIRSPTVTSRLPTTPMHPLPPDGGGTTPTSSSSFTMTP